MSVRVRRRSTGRRSYGTTPCCRSPPSRTSTSCSRPASSTTARRSSDELRAREPDIERAFARLAASPVPITIDHGDLHDGNVFSRDGRPRLIDWGDATVAHPLTTLALEPDDPAATAGYIETWSTVASHDELERDLQDVREVRWLLRAINYARVLPYDPSHAEGIELRVRMYLEA